MVEASTYRAVMPGTEVSFILQIRDGKETGIEVKNKDGTLLKGFSNKLEATQMIGTGPLEPGSKLGKVKFYNTEKGFGFITPDDQSDELFFNIADVQGRAVLDKEEPVRYCIGEGKNPGTTQAKNIKRLIAAPAPTQEYNPYGGISAYSGYNQAPPQPFSHFGGPPAAVAPAGYYGAQTPAAGYGLAPPQSGLGGASLTGTIKWYNEEKGFGFIVPGNGDKDVYFKGNAIIDGSTSFNEEDPVTYEMREQDGKAWATNVSRAKSAQKRKAGDMVYPDPNAAFKMQRSEGPFGQHPAQPSPYGETTPAGYFGGAPTAAAAGSGAPSAGYYNQAPGNASQYPGYGGAASYDPYGTPAQQVSGRPADPQQAYASAYGERAPANYASQQASAPAQGYPHF